MDWVNGALLIGVLLLLLESRISMGNKLVVLETDMEWLRASLVKWGMIPPTEHDRK